MGSLFVFVTTILSSGVLAALISSSLSENKDYRSFKRAKIEEIYINADLWSKDIGTHNIAYLRAISGAISFNDAFDIIIGQKGKALPTYHTNLNMNIRMYEPSLISFLDKITEDLDQFNTTVSIAKEKYKSTGNCLEFSQQTQIQALALASSCENLLKEIIKRGVDIGLERGHISKILIGAKLGAVHFYSQTRKFLRRKDR
jgi:hypothetical protein